MNRREMRVPTGRGVLSFAGTLPDGTKIAWSVGDVQAMELDAVKVVEEEDYEDLFSDGDKVTRRASNFFRTLEMDLRVLPGQGERFFEAAFGEEAQTWFMAYCPDCDIKMPFDDSLKRTTWVNEHSTSWPVPGEEKHDKVFTFEWRGLRRA